MVFKLSIKKLASVNAGPTQRRVREAGQLECLEAGNVLAICKKA